MDPKWNSRSYLNTEQHPTKWNAKIRINLINLHLHKITECVRVYLWSFARARVCVGNESVFAVRMSFALYVCLCLGGVLFDQLINYMVENQITYGFFGDGETFVVKPTARCRSKRYRWRCAIIPRYIGCRSSTNHLLKQEREKINKKVTKIIQLRSAIGERGIQIEELNESIHPYIV